MLRRHEFTRRTQRKISSDKVDEAYLLRKSAENVLYLQVDTHANALTNGVLLRGSLDLPTNIDISPLSQIPTPGQVDITLQNGMT